MARLTTKGITKGFNGKKINNIFTYATSLGAIVNPNCRGLALSNPIQVFSALETLQELQKEIQEITIDINDIDIENIFNAGASRNEIEQFIFSINNGLSLSTYYPQYSKMKANEDLEIIYPMELRVKRRNELQLQIDKMIQANAKLYKVSPSLAKTKEAEIRDLQKELNDLIESLDIATPEELKMNCYALAVYFIDHLKLIITNHIDYLTELVEVLA